MRLPIALVGILLAGCAASASNRAPRGADPNILMASEIEQSNVGTLHEAIQRLRPHFFFARGRTSMRGPDNPRPAVIVDNVPQTSFESLKAISARDVQYVRFLTAPEATTRFGTGYMAGAIEVVLK